MIENNKNPRVIMYETFHLHHIEDLSLTEMAESFLQSFNAGLVHPISINEEEMVMASFPLTEEEMKEAHEYILDNYPETSFTKVEEGKIKYTVVQLEYIHGYGN